jgi:hypothetical protein
MTEEKIRKIFAVIGVLTGWLCRLVAVAMGLYFFFLASIVEEATFFLISLIASVLFFLVAFFPFPRVCKEIFTSEKGERK